MTILFLLSLVFIAIVGLGGWGASMMILETILFILTPFWFALAYAIKGGQGASIFRNFERVRNKNKILERLLDGKVLSAILVLIWSCFATVWTQSSIGHFTNASFAVVVISIGWLISIAPSMGEEYASIMNSQTQNPYQKHPEFGRAYGIKKGIQRGIFSGAMLCLATGSLWFIVSSLLFVPLAWLALNYAPTKIFDRWGWSEILIGFFVFGLPFAFIL